MKAYTQISRAKKGEITDEISVVSKKENCSTTVLKKMVAQGAVVIPANIHHSSLSAEGIGKSLKVKINANIGNSQLSSCLKNEIKKLNTAIRYGANAVMDLSTGTNIREIRKALLDQCSVPFGTVPVYEAAGLVQDTNEISANMLLEIIEEQAEQGVDFMTVHAGLLKAHIPLAMKRKLKIVSRGGAIMAKWIKKHKKENPLYENFNKLLSICAKHDVTLSLGDGLRPGCIADASDKAQFAELKTLGELVMRCRGAGVQVMVEGPGHIPIDQIKMNMELEDKLCHGAPFYVLGPLVMDCAPGYDHIVGAIGGAIGAFYGAAMLCYVTPMEHIGLPEDEDVRNGVIAFRIAAHAADIALKKYGSIKRDNEISSARAKFEWEKQFSFAIDPDRAREYRAKALKKIKKTGIKSDNHEKDEYCSMCGPKFCPMKLLSQLQKS